MCRKKLIWQKRRPHCPLIQGQFQVARGLGAVAISLHISAIVSTSLDYLDCVFVTWSPGVLTRAHLVVAVAQILETRQQLPTWAPASCFCHWVKYLKDQRETTANGGFPVGSVVKNPSTNAGDTSSRPGSGRSLREGDGNLPQYSCLKNPMDRGVRQAIVRGVTKDSDMNEWLNNSNWQMDGSSIVCKNSGPESVLKTPYTWIGLEYTWNQEVSSVPLSLVQSLNHVQLFATPWIAARQTSLSITNSRSSPKLMSMESVMPSSHLILCCPLLLLPPTPPSIRLFSNESTLVMRWPEYWSFIFSIIPSKEIPGLISFRINWLDVLAVQGTLKSLLQHHSLKASILQCSAFFTVQLSHPYMTTGKTIALTRWTSSSGQRLEISWARPIDSPKCTKMKIKVYLSSM